jgi:hypothetical protein
MKCKKSVRRIEEICEELMELIDDSRAHGDTDECELLCCVVHDSVQKMQRAMTRMSPDGPAGSGRQSHEPANFSNRIVN